MNHFHYINRINGVRILGKITILMGLIVLAVPFLLEVETAISKVFLVGGIAVAIGVLMTSLFSGTLIDFESKRFKAYQSILWIKFGEWEGLPKIENVELIHHSYNETNTPNGISPTLSREVTAYKCVVIAEGRKFMVFEYSKETDAIAALDIIRDGLKISKTIQE